jgi:hypothetical protein
MSKLTAVAYYGGIPPNNKNPEKPLILDYFCQGVSSCSDTAIQHRTFQPINCDVALIQGFVHEDGKNMPHLNLRKQALTLQRNIGKKSLIVDSNLFLFADQGNSKHYLRYSFDGVFPTTGFYFDKDIDPSRWIKISKNLNVNLLPYRQTGDHILICLQRNGGWSMKGLNSLEWLSNTINIIKQHSDRKIIVRAHPGDKKTQGFIKLHHKNVMLSQKEKLVDDLANAWATVVYNSSPSVASLIMGVPAFLTDPMPQNSQSYGVANLDISKIETPVFYERQQWIEKISMCHWNFDELKSGEAWSFFKRYV